MLGSCDSTKTLASLASSKTVVGGMCLNVTVEFYDRFGNMTTMESVTKLVRPGTVGFWSGPDFRSSAAVTSEEGKVLHVFYTAL